MANILMTLVGVTTLVLLGVIGNLLALYQIRDRLDTAVKLLEKNNKE